MLVNILTQNRKIDEAGGNVVLFIEKD